MAKSVDRHSREVAVVAARLMQEQGLDYLAAKKKAALKLGLGVRAALPTNRQIEDALLEHHRLFHHEATQEALVTLREIALEMMDHLAAFEPRLVGAVLSGALTSGAAIELHAFADSAEAIAVMLIDHRIDYRLVERRVRMRAEHTVLIPVYLFEHRNVDIEVYAFALDGQRQPPLCPVDGKPMERARASAVRTLLEPTSGPSVVDDFFSRV
ncbi:MAG: hypothetical protein AAF465_11930 [Pseudomonadota bacterium]